MVLSNCPGFNHAIGNDPDILNTRTPLATYLLESLDDAFIAVSTRRLRGDYFGACLRVRRSSDDAETNIGFKGEDLDTDALEWFCSGTDGYVTTWYGQQGGTYAGSNLVRAEAATQPKIVSSGSVIEMLSKPTLEWSTTTNTRLITPTYGDNFTDVFTSYHVCERSATGADDTIFTVKYANPVVKYPSGDDFEGYMTTYVNGEGGIYMSTAASTTDPHIMKFVCDSTNGFTITQNKTTSDTATFTDQGNWSDITSPYLVVGYWYDAVSFDGYISELIIIPGTAYSGVTTTEDNINDYFGAY